MRNFFTKKHHTKKQRGGRDPFTHEEKVLLTNAIKGIRFVNRDGPIDDTKISQIITHLNTVPDFRVSDLLILTQSFITSEVGFDDYLHKKYNYFPVDTEMEKDTHILPNKVSYDKKLNGGKKKNA